MRHFKIDEQGVASQADTFEERRWVIQSNSLDDGRLGICLDGYPWRHVLITLCNCIFLCALKSLSFFQWKEVLWHQIFLYVHFHLSPTQVGIPNYIPRHYGFTVSSRKENNFRGDFFQKLLFPKQVAYDKESKLSINTHTSYIGKKKFSIPPI